jgi:hypothetical protein
MYVPGGMSSVMTIVELPRDAVDGEYGAGVPENGVAVAMAGCENGLEPTVGACAIGGADAGVGGGTAIGAGPTAGIGAGIGAAVGTRAIISWLMIGPAWAAVIFPNILDCFSTNGRIKAADSNALIAA